MENSASVVECSHLGPFAFMWNTDANIDVFRRAFLHVWEVMPVECQEPIRESCMNVAFERRLGDLITSNNVGSLNVAAGVTYFRSDRKSEVAFQSSMCRESSYQGVCNIIAHELRHSWQHATNFQETVPIDELVKAQALRNAIEDDACQFAIDLGFSPESIWNLSHIPDDAEFVSLLGSWGLLPPETRRTLTESAAAEAAGMRKSISLCWSDRRFLDVRDTWEKLTSEQRDEFSAMIMGKFTGCN